MTLNPLRREPNFLKQVLDAVSSLKPEQIQTLLASAGRGAVVYLVGAGGCGVSGLAHLLLDAGFSVQGSDAVENEEIRQLRARGAAIHIGHRAEQLRAANAALVVYSPAVQMDNPELQLARELNLPIVRRALLLAAFVNSQRGICVAGMHGKTTTSALLAWALEKLGHSPSYAIGASLPQMPAHARLSNGAERWFVAEADESDGTLKEFLPTHSIVLNVDNEHLDHFPDMEAVCREFERFVANTRGTVVFCADDERVTGMTARRPGAVSYGFNSLAEYRVEPKAQMPKSEAREDRNEFTVWHRGERLGDFAIALLGDKNISNATAVLALLHQIGHPPAAIREAIAGFRGAARRQQELFGNQHVRVFDDYGHHPNEIRAVLRALKGLSPQRLVVVFQPHRYTRTLKLMGEFAGAFGEADKLFITEVYAASEPEIPGANGAALADALRARGQVFEYVPSLSDVAPAVMAAIQSGDLVLFLGAGDITRAAHEVAHTLRTRADRLPVQAMNASSTPNVFENLRSSVSAATVVRAQEPLARRTTLRVVGRRIFLRSLPSKRTWRHCCARAAN